MRDVFDKDITEAKVNLAQVKRDMNNFESQLAAAVSTLQTLEEQCRTTEDQIKSSNLELRNTDREISSLKLEIRQRKMLTKPENNPLDSIEKFLTVSEAVFSPETSKKNEESIFASSLRQSPSGALQEIAVAAESILRLKKDVPLLVKAEKELGRRKREDRRPRVEEVLRTDLARVAENSILVVYTDFGGVKQECQFPVTTAEGYKMTFAELLVNACRYWMLYDRGFVLVDREMKVLPGTAPIDEELSPQDRVVSLMPKDEVEQGQTSPLLEKLLEKGSDDPTLLKSTDRTQTIETSRIDQELFNSEEEKLQKLKRRHLKLETVRRRRLLNVINLLIYILFEVMFTWSLTEENNILQNYNVRQAVYEGILNLQFPDYGNNGWTFYQIVNQKYFTMFMQQPFMTLFVNDTGTDPRYFEGYMRKVGEIRLIQKRVKDRSCTYEDYGGSLGNAQKYCYADFSPDVEETADMLLPGIPQDYLSWTTFRHQDSPRVVTGTMRSYSLEGYEVYFPPDALYSDVLPAVNYLINTWIDVQTRLLVIDINFCNQNVDTCVAFEMMFEFLAGGVIVPTEFFYQYRVNRNWTVADKVRLGFEYTIDAIMVYFLFTIVQECRRLGFRQGIRQFWLLMESFLILMVFLRQFLVLIYQEEHLIQNFNIDATEYRDLMTPAYIYKLLTNFEGFTLFLAYLTMFKFLQNSSSMSIIWGTLRQSMISVVFFFMVFSLVFMGWVLLGYKLFGKDTIDFKSIGTSATTLMQTILGNNDLDTISAFNLVSAYIFFIIFSVSSNFLMLNIFLAIINESYDTVYKRIKTEKKDELLIILSMILKGIKFTVIDIPVGLVLLKPCRKRGKEREEEKIQKELEELSDEGE